MSDSAASAAAGGVSAVSSIVGLAVAILVLVGMWKIFVKAGKPGWGAIIPFYNLYCLFDMSFGKGWMFLLTIIPIVNVVVEIILCVKLAKAFGKGGGFAVGLIFFPFIFVPVLGFGDAEYIGLPQG